MGHGSGLAGFHDLGSGLEGFHDLGSGLEGFHGSGVGLRLICRHSFQNNRFLN